MTSALVPVAAVFLACSLLAGGAAALVPRLAPKRWLGSSLLWSASIGGPLVVASIATLALVIPTPFSPCHCLEHGHHPHICLVHSELAASLVLPALAVVLVWGLAALPRLSRAVRELFAALTRVRALRKLPAEDIGEARVRFADCGSPIAFTAGALGSMIVVDRALWSSISELERKAVLEHELGHVERGDAFTYATLRLCLALQPWLPAALLERWRHAAELACDRRAAERVGDPASVAEALVSVGRLQSRARMTDEWALGLMGAESLQARVLALLEAGPESASRGNDVLSVVLPALGLVALALAWPGDAVHHAIETLIGLLSP